MWVNVFQSFFRSYGVGGTDFWILHKDSDQYLHMTHKLSWNPKLPYKRQFSLKQISHFNDVLRAKKKSVFTVSFAENVIVYNLHFEYILYWYRLLWLTFCVLNCVPKTYRMVIFYTCFDKRVTTGKQKAFLSHLENPVKSHLKGFLLKYALEPIEKNFYVYF